MSLARPVRAHYEQRSEETSVGHIANEKWLTAQESATLRERQRLYLQDMPYCPSLRKTTVGRNFLRQSVTRDARWYPCLFPSGLRRAMESRLRVW